MGDNDEPGRIFLVFHGRLPILRRGGPAFNGESDLLFCFVSSNHWLSARMMLSNGDSVVSKTRQRLAFLKLTSSHGGGGGGVQH